MENDNGDILDAGKSIRYDVFHEGKNAASSS